MYGDDFYQALMLDHRSTALIETKNWLVLKDNFGLNVRCCTLQAFFLTVSRKYDFVFSSDDDTDKKSEKKVKKKKKKHKKHKTESSDSESEGKGGQRKKSHVSLLFSFYQLRSRGDNTFGSVHLSVCPSICPSVTTLSFWHEG